jgi:hypothetical protein
VLFLVLFLGGRPRNLMIPSSRSPFRGLKHVQIDQVVMILGIAVMADPREGLPERFLSARVTVVGPEACSGLRLRLLESRPRPSRSSSLQTAVWSWTIQSRSGLLRGFLTPLRALWLTPTRLPSRQMTCLG